MAVTHRALGFAAGTVYGTVSGLPWPVAAIAGAVATVTAAGPLSPDADQYRWWRAVDTLTPDEILGAGGPLQHRGITHWWLWPALLTAGWWTGWLRLDLEVAGASATHGVWLLVGALLAGWWSHLAGDFVFGARDPYSGRGPGVPIAPWWGHVGLGIRCGGFLEGAAGLLIVAGTVWLLAAAAGLAPDFPTGATLGWSR